MAFHLAFFILADSQGEMSDLGEQHQTVTFYARLQVHSNHSLIRVSETLCYIFCGIYPLSSFLVKKYQKSLYFM